MVGEPALLNTTVLQVPFPLARVMVQLVSAPVMVTVPVGVRPAPVTVTLTVTASPATTGLGVWAVMAVLDGPLLTVWLAVVLLPA
jgi:hypothetical protein